jgi:hypothetical protein
MVGIVRFQSAGLDCSADLYLPDDLLAGERRAGLVIGHGFSLVRSMLVDQAEVLRNAGFVVLAIDYRSFGDSEGATRGELFPLNEVEDYRNAISYLQGRDDVDPERIGIWGTSFAGALVTYIAAIDRRVKATVAQVPVTDGYTWLKLLRGEAEWAELLAAADADRAKRLETGHGARIPVTGRAGTFCALPSDQQIVDFFGGAKDLFPTWDDSITLESIERIIEFSPISIVDRISPRPLMIVGTSGYDVVHPAWTVTELYERARQPKRLELLPFDQVGLYSEPGLSVAMELAAGFFHEHLSA